MTQYTGHVDLAALPTRDEVQKNLDREMGNVKTFFTLLLSIVGLVTTVLITISGLTFHQSMKQSDALVQLIREVGESKSQAKADFAELRHNIQALQASLPQKQGANNENIRR